LAPEGGKIVGFVEERSNVMRRRVKDDAQVVVLFLTNNSDRCCDFMILTNRAMLGPKMKRRGGWYYSVGCPAFLILDGCVPSSVEKRLIRLGTRRQPLYCKEPPEANSIL
jgi:hypothetical protein